MRYQAYGSTLDTDLEFTDLPAAPHDATPRWILRRAAQLPAMRNATARGEELLYDGAYARAIAHADGCRVVIDGTGSFDIAPDGRMTVVPEPGASPEFVRGHFIGRVLATALFDLGWLPLHASAVQTREGVVAFLGPKRVGKSTLALAMARAGAALVSDDVCPIEPRTPPLAWPGVHTLRVQPDTAASLGVADPGIGHEGKHAITQAAWLRTATAARPLAALFLLSPREGADAAPPARIPYAPALAAAAVAAHVRPAGMLGPAGVAAMFERLAPVVRLVPVHQLPIDRDLGRVDAVARTILEWYGGPA